MSVIIVAEIGINHNGDMELAKKLIDAAAFSGADYVKFQKRCPEECVPRDQWHIGRDTPWGRMTYLDYRHRMEFDAGQYMDLWHHAKRRDIGMFFSVWDVTSADFAAQFAFDYMKLPSAKLTNVELVQHVAGLVAESNVKGMILSAGMTGWDDVVAAVDGARKALDNATAPDRLDLPELWLLHCHSAYPAPTAELNLLCIQRMQAELAPAYGLSVGYSGHEFGMAPTEWAVALGAQMVERHITLDRTMWGTDQMASLEPLAFMRLVQHIRSQERALGDGEKIVWPSEMPALLKLRGVPDDEVAD